MNNPPAPPAPDLPANPVRLVLDRTAAMLVKQLAYHSEYGSTDPGRTALDFTTAVRQYVEAEAIAAGAADVEPGSEELPPA